MAFSCWYCISSITVARGDRPAQPGHVKTPRTQAWLLAVQGTATVNPDSQFNGNSFSWAIAERNHGQTRACVLAMAPTQNGVVTVTVSSGKPKPCSDSARHTVYLSGKVLSRLCRSCFPTDIHLKPSPSVLLYSKPSHPTTHHAYTPTSFHTQEESAL